MKQLQFLLFALLSAGVLIFLSSCKKEETKPTISLTVLNGKWKEQNGSEEYVFNLTAQVSEAKPHPQGLTNPPILCGELTHWYNGSNPIPLLPDPRYVEEGEVWWRIIYAPNSNFPKLIITEGYSNYLNKRLMVNGDPVDFPGSTGAGEKSLNLSLIDATEGQEEAIINGSIFIKDY